MKIVNRNIAELNAAVYNPRKLSDEERANIRASLDKFGFVDPIIVNKHPERVDVIVGGHQRVKIWGGDMGNDKIPTVEVSLAEDDERELNVRLNRNAGAWDFEKLAAEFSFDELDEWGFDESELEEIFPKIEGMEFPDLGDGEDPPCQTVSFVFSNEQKEDIDAAIGKAGTELDCVDAVNENENGNRLAAIVRAWLND